MKTILITGATSGIGEALALECAKRQYKVIACGRNQQKLDELALHQNIQVRQFDVTNKQQIAEALADVDADIYVLNAGVCEYVDVDDFEATMFERVFAANFFGTVNVCQALLKQLEPGNQLVIVDSLARLLPFTRSQAYGASKAATHYFSQSMAVDLAAKGIIVQSVSPGFVATPLTDKNDFDMPMKISAEDAAKALLKGIEKQQKSVYFPTFFSLILRFIARLPGAMKVWICRRMKQQESSSS